MAKKYRDPLAELIGEEALDAVYRLMTYQRRQAEHEYSPGEFAMEVDKTGVVETPVEIVSGQEIPGKQPGRRFNQVEVVDLDGDRRFVPKHSLKPDPLGLDEDVPEHNPDLGRDLTEADLKHLDVSKLDYGTTRRRQPKGLFVEPIRNPEGAVALCETFHGDDGACDSYVEKQLWMPGPIVLLGACVDCGYNVTDRKSEKSGRYVHDHEAGVKLYRRAKDGERATKTLKPPRQVFVLGDWLGCTYDDGERERELTGSSRVKACTDNGKRLFAIHSTKGCLYVISGGSFRIRDWMYD